MSIFLSRQSLCLCHQTFQQAGIQNLFQNLNVHSDFLIVSVRPSFQNISSRNLIEGLWFLFPPNSRCSCTSVSISHGHFLRQFRNHTCLRLYLCLFCRSNNLRIIQSMQPENGERIRGQLHGEFIPCSGKLIVCRYNLVRLFDAVFLIRASFIGQLNHRCIGIDFIRIVFQRNVHALFFIGTVDQF